MFAHFFREFDWMAQGRSSNKEGHKAKNAQNGKLLVDEPRNRSENFPTSTSGSV